MTADLAAWLTSVWDEEEASAQLSIELTERAYPADEFNVRWKWARLTEHKTSGGGGHSFEPGAPSPQQVLARIAADRKILEIHSPLRHAFPEDAGLCDTCPSLWPCTTVLALASPYADREGFRPEWLVERQGVEG